MVYKWSPIQTPIFIIVCFSVLMIKRSENEIWEKLLDFPEIWLHCILHCIFGSTGPKHILLLTFVWFIKAWHSDGSNHVKNMGHQQKKVCEIWCQSYIVIFHCIKFWLLLMFSLANNHFSSNFSIKSGNFIHFWKGNE